MISPRERSSPAKTGGVSSIFRKRESEKMREDEVTPSVSCEPYVEAACTIINDVLQQVVLKDSPPANDNFGETENTSLSRQCHGRLAYKQMKFANDGDDSASRGEVLSLDSSDQSVSLAPSAFLQLYIRESIAESLHSKAPQAHRMGAANFQALSTWTLERFGYAPIPLEIETNILLSQLTPLGNGECSSFSNKQVKNNKKRGSFWKRKKENHMPPTQRLQMYGSEYARHASTSALAPPAASTRTTKIRNKVHSRKRKGPILEGAASSVLAGAIVDICITVGSEPPPLGFYRITQTATGQPFALPRKKNLYLNVKKEPDWNKAVQRPCVTAITIIFPDRKEFVPPGFSVVKRQGEPADLGDNERVFICFRRSREGNPLTALLPLSPGLKEHVPEGFAVIEKTPRNLPAVLAPNYFLSYRQRLASLEPLRPYPLLCSLQDPRDHSEELQAYYCTGGTVVPSDVGHFHIMDRSTHSLLSPSSVINRLSVIENSRQRGKEHIKLVNNPTLSTDSFGMSDHSSVSNNGSRNSSFQEPLRAEQPCTSFDSELLSLLAQNPQHHVETSGTIPLKFIPRLSVAHATDDASEETETLKSREAVLLPILTACYARQGGGPLLAVDGLYKLLKHQDFFSDDVADSDIVDNEASTRITLLDVAIQGVCDVATTGAQEITFASCVEFVHEAIHFSKGRLNTRTIGFALRLYLFVFHFETSIPSRSTVWPNPSWSFRNKGGLSMLHDPREENRECSYLPGGAPQVAALALKDLISLSLLRFKKATRCHQEQRRTESITVPDEVSPVDDDVECANFIQLALHQIQRASGSELFWHDMIHVCGRGIFAKTDKLDDASRDICVMTFAVLTSIVKVSSGKIRFDRRTEMKPLPRDRAGKLLSLELLLHFLEYMSLEQEGNENRMPPPQPVERIAYCVRRTVAPCMLQNTEASLLDSAIFSRVIRIVSELWCSPFYRERCKAELGLLIDHFAIAILRLGPQIHARSSKDRLGLGDLEGTLFEQQVELIREVKTWFSQDPKDLLEMYLNYDTDLSCHLQHSDQHLPGTQLNIYSKLCSEISCIVERCGETLREKIESSSHRQLKNKQSRMIAENLLAIRTKSGRRVTEAAKVLRLASLETFEQMVKALAISASASVGKDTLLYVLSWCGNTKPITYESSLSGSSDGSRDKITISSESRSAQAGTGERQHHSSAATHNSEQGKPSTKESLEIAVTICQQKSLRKAVEYLIACKALSSAPRDVVSYIRANHDKFDPIALGVYLGEDGVGPAETEYWNSIRYLYVRSDTYIGLTVEQGLRRFLVDTGFRLPGEAQKIDRIVGAFAMCFFEDNAGDSRFCPFSNEDSVYVLCFAIIMLNTDLHKSNKLSKKSNRVMSKEEFVKNLRGVDEGQEIPRDYLVKVYDSILANAIVVDTSFESGASSREARRKPVKQILSNVRTAESLLRGFAVRHFRFAKIQDYCDTFTRDQLGAEFVSDGEHSGSIALHDLARSCVSSTWHQWYGLVNTGFKMAYLEPHAMTPLISILRYALTATICLDLPTAFIAFLDQLGQLKSFSKSGEGKWGVEEASAAFRDETWYTQILTVIESSSSSRRIWTLRRVHEEIESFRPSLLTRIQNKAEMIEAVEQLEGGSYLVDTTRMFLKSGQLVKRSARSGRLSSCWFFLFSDVLVHAKENETGRLQIHDQFQVHLLKVVDWFPPSEQDKARHFEVHHPTKSFQIICSSEEEKKAWVIAIRDAEHKLRYANRPVL